MNAPTAPTQYEIIKSKISELQSALLSAHPTMPILLQEIRRIIKNDPATVTLLAEEDIAVIVNGLEKQTNTFIAASMTKSSTAKTKALKSVTSNDLGFD